MRSTPRDPGARVALVLLLAIVLVAAMLRFWGLTQGGPLPNGRPDEREMLERTAAFASGDLNPRWFVYPNLFFWVSWLWIELVLAVTRLWRPVADYATVLASDLPRLLLLGRALSALVGTATVAVLYVIGRGIGGRRLGLVAALLLATNFLHVRDSHALKTESFLALGTLVSIALVAHWAADRSTGRALRAGIAIGITTAFKYNGLMLLFVVWLADLAWSPRRGLTRLLPSPAFFGITSVALVTFLACSPFLLLDLQRTRETVTLINSAIFASRPAPPSAAPKPDRLTALRRAVEARAARYHVTVSLRRGAGIAVAVLTPLAVLLAFRTPRAPMLVLAAAFSLVYFAVIGSSPVHLARYLTPITPLIALLVAHLLVWITDRAPRRLGVPALVVLALAIVAEPLHSAVAYDRIAARTDTRVLATEWMTDNLPPGAVVARLGTLVFALADPELPPGVKPAALKLGQTDLRGTGVTHVVTHEHALVFSRLIKGQMEALGPHLRLLATFDPYGGRPPGGSFEAEDAYYIPFWDFDGVERPGPLVHVYAWDPPEAAAR